MSGIGLTRKMKLGLAGAVSLCLLTALPAGAQSVLGKAVVEGRVVDLLSDGTWRYADGQSHVGQSEAGKKCDELPSRISFCGLTDGWTKTKAPAPDIAAQYRHDDRHYGQFIIEALGSDDGFNFEFMRNAVLENAAAGTGQQREDIIVLDVTPSTVDGHEAQTVTYALRINQLDVVFANTIVILPRRTAQVMTFAIGKTLTDEHTALNAEFLSYVRFGE